MGYESREEFLDALYDHLRGEDEEWDEDDDNWFTEKFESFFHDDGIGPKKIGRRRAGKQPASPKRRPGSSSQGQGKRSQGDSGYGLGLFYGGKSA